MTDPIDRRALLAFTGLASVTIPGFARADGGAAADAYGRRDSSAAGKQVVEVPKDNSVFGASAAAFAKFGYSPAVRAEGLLYIAGVVGVRPDGTVPNSAAEQAELAFQRTVEILRLEGLSMADLVEVVSYHADLAKNIRDFLSVKERYTARPFPAWSIIGVEALTRPELKIEIRSIAALRG